MARSSWSTQNKLHVFVLVFPVVLVFVICVYFTFFCNLRERENMRSGGEGVRRTWEELGWGENVIKCIVWKNFSEIN